MVHGEADAEHVDEDPQHVQHIVPEWSLKEKKLEDLPNILRSDEIPRNCAKQVWSCDRTWMSGQDGLFR